MMQLSVSVAFERKTQLGKLKKYKIMFKVNGEDEEKRIIDRDRDKMFGE
jgi:hypothetical protein